MKKNALIDYTKIIRYRQIVEIVITMQIVVNKEKENQSKRIAYRLFYINFPKWKEPRNLTKRSTVRELSHQNYICVRGSFLRHTSISKGYRYQLGICSC